MPPSNLRDAESLSDRPRASVPPGIDKTLTKGLVLLEALSRSARSRGVSDLANELSLTKSNVHRLLQTLMNSGFVSQEPYSDKYVLTSKLWRLSRMQHHNALLSLVHPALSALVAETGETATFAVVEGKDIVMIDQVETQHTVRVFYSVGEAHPLDHVLLSGRGLSALQLIAYSFQPDTEVRNALETISRELQRPASYMKGQVTRIKQVRKDGYALNQDEWVEGVSAAAAAVTGRSSELVGIVVSFGPTQRLPTRVLDTVRQATCAAAVLLSAKLRG